MRSVIVLAKTRKDVSSSVRTYKHSESEIALAMSPLQHHSLRDERTAEHQVGDLAVERGEGLVVTAFVAVGVGLRGGRGRRVRCGGHGGIFRCGRPPVLRLTNRAGVQPSRTSIRATPKASSAKLLGCMAQAHTPFPGAVRSSRTPLRI